ncbi:MAG: hypothetical protein ABSH34_08420 [Verrucomicrobiota bacterium]
MAALPQVAAVTVTLLVSVTQWCGNGEDSLGPRGDNGVAGIAAWEDAKGGGHSLHDAHYLTFH